MKINVIGDIHGRTSWKDLVIEDATNVFVGDYFDPYDSIGVEDLIKNFCEICEYARQYKNTILLYGNHDFHYIVPEYGGSTSRYDYLNASKIRKVLDSNSDLFYGVAYSPDPEHLISHAGVTLPWLNKYLDTDDFTGIYVGDTKVPNAKEMESFVNHLWDTDKSAFSFENNCISFSDCYGISPTHSPIWVRPQTIYEYNAYADTNIIQIFGHTQVKRLADMSEENGLVLVDCLGNTVESYTYTPKEL